MSLMIGLPVQFFLQNILQYLASQRQHHRYWSTNHPWSCHWLTRDVYGRRENFEQWIQGHNTEEETGRVGSCNVEIVID